MKLEKVILSPATFLLISLMLLVSSYFPSGREYDFSIYSSWIFLISPAVILEEDLVVGSQ